MQEASQNVNLSKRKQVEKDYMRAYAKNRDRVVSNISTGKVFPDLDNNEKI